MTLWQIALALWMGMYALFTLTNVAVENGKFIMGVLAVIVCICLLLGNRTWRGSNPVVA